MSKNNTHHIDTETLILTALEKTLDNAVILARRGTQGKVEIFLSPVSGYTQLFVDKVEQVLKAKNLFTNIKIEEYVTEDEIKGNPTDEKRLKLSLDISIPENYTDCKTEWEKALWWMKNGERGASSLTIWNALIGNKDFQISIPYDRGDFGRCYELFQTVPEWKSKLHDLRKLSPEWDKLIENWKKLSKAYEDSKNNPHTSYKRIFDLTLQLARK